MLKQPYLSRLGKVLGVNGTKVGHISREVRGRDFQHIIGPEEHPSLPLHVPYVNRQRSFARLQSYDVVILRLKGLGA
jgi:hypothetical protein